MDTFLHKTFRDPHTRHFRIANDVLAMVTVVAVIGLVLETVNTLAPYSHILRAIELGAVAIFCLEYAARLYSTRPRRRYVFSFFGIIDLVAILPTLLGLGNLTFLKTSRALRLLRFLRILQLAKMSRVANRDETSSLSVYTFSVLIYLVVLLLSLLTFGTILYLVEPSHPSFASIPHAMWWSLKVFVGSVPVAAPETAVGEALYVSTRFVGLLLLGLLIGIVGNLFRIALAGKKPVSYE